MSTPPPDPHGRLPAANPAAPGPVSGSEAVPEAHQPADPLADLLRSPTAGRGHSTGSDIAQLLAHPPAVVGNTDDEPTVITQHDALNAAPKGSTPRPGAAPPPGDPPPSIAGRRLGIYELIEAVGAGGMAAVLKARDLELGRVVALKILPPDAARDPESVNRFKQEARAAARLDHDNIARVYACGEDQGLHFIAFEFVEGINLRQMIDRRGPLPAAECIRYMLQVAAGLHHAAERGVVHRDIKPSNILVTPDGRAKIVDMGLARHLGSESVNGGVTQSGVTLGTFDYISPEQALDPRRADVRSDIYSLGCAFYHALTGRPPVPEGTAARKLRAHQHEPILDPRALNPAIPDELAAVLARMMAKNPAQRYQTPAELIAHLKGLAERLQIGTDAIGHDTAAQAVPTELRLLPEPPRLPVWWVAAGVAVALAVVAFVVATTNPAPIANGTPGGTDSTKPKQPEQPHIDDPGKARPPNPNAPVRTAEELVERLADPQTKRIVLAAGEFDLSKLATPIVFQGKELDLIGVPIATPGGGTKLILPASPGRGPGSLTLKAESLSVRNVWFELAPTAGADSPASSPSVALRVEDARDVNFIDCVFVPSTRADFAPRAVVVSRVAEGPVRVFAERCLFAPGAAAIVVPAGAFVQITDSGFAPHAAAILFEAPVPGDLPPLAEVRLDRSSFMLDPGGAAVETSPSARVQVIASDCVFAPVHILGGPPGRPALTPESVRRGVVVRVRGDRPTGAEFVVPEGRANGFYTVDPLGTTKETLPFEECKLRELPVAERGRVELKARPWSERDSLSTLAEEVPWKAFRLRVEEEPALFTTDRRGDKKQSWVPLGATFHNEAEGSLRRAYPDLYLSKMWPPERPIAVTELKRKVWYPDAKPSDMLKAGTYADLPALLKHVRPGDEVLIRHNGELKVDGVDLKAQTRPGGEEFRVTFKPYEGSAPVLVIQGDEETDQSLFKLKSGEVAFDGLHFKLKAGRDRNEVVSAVSILGGRSCTFRNCVFTLAESDDTHAAAVYMPDADLVMMMDPATRPVPRVTFENCVIRGRGRAVWVEVSRPVNLEMTNTLTALDGPIFLAEAGGKGTTAQSTAKLTRITALTGGPVVEMRGGQAAATKPAGLVPLHVEANECLFIAVPSAGRPLVDLEGVDPTDVKAVFTWQVKRPNRYANYDTSASAIVAAIRPGGDGVPREWNWDDWIANVGEPALPDTSKKRVGKLTFEKRPDLLKELGEVHPADVVPTAVEFPDVTGAKLTDAGANLKVELLPFPSPE